MTRITTSPRLVLAFFVSTFILNAPGARAATCPFDAGGSGALNDGVVLTRYALGLTGAPLTASTRYASLDPLQVKNNIECVGCALDMNGDDKIDTVDTTIIARHLTGFKGASLTGGLTLGAGTRNTTAAVTSFLANGCAVGGAINAFVQGGNAFGAPAVLGASDGQPLTVGIGGGNGLRVVPSSIVNAPNMIGGSSANFIASAVRGGAIAGGGIPGGDTDPDFLDEGPNRVVGHYGFVGGGKNNVAGSLVALPKDAAFATVAGGDQNVAGQYAATVGGGQFNQVTLAYGTVAGGVLNLASGLNASVGGGNFNTASGNSSTVPGGNSNTASGAYSFAAGRGARATHDRSFVWGGDSTVNTGSTGPGSFVVYAPGAINMYAGAAGAGGCTLSNPSSGWACSSDRALKTNVRSLDARDVLKRVVSMPVTRWSFKGAEPFTHIGPMAQDFKAAFGLGGDDKTISSMDSVGVALAAIQGLNQLLAKQQSAIATKDSKIAHLESEIAAIKRSLAALTAQRTRR